MSTILETYKVQFSKRIINKRTLKLIYSINDVLDQCIADYKTVDEVNNFLIAEINKVLNGVSSSETIISESMVSVVISSDTTKFYQDPNYSPTASPDYSIPTQDFKVIAQAWLSYLQNN
ncbi:MAG: hypothetical protein JST50_04770 [Bacteroidetes bacterium]|jgi:hypothetical protein|nr:hypothetical protein [Bacteroidota bacterium]